MLPSSERGRLAGTLPSPPRPQLPRAKQVLARGVCLLLLTKQIPLCPHEERFSGDKPLTSDAGTGSSSLPSILLPQPARGAAPATSPTTATAGGCRGESRGQGQPWLCHQKRTPRSGVISCDSVNDAEHSVLRLRCISTRSAQPGAACGNRLGVTIPSGAEGCVNEGSRWFSARFPLSHSVAGAPAVPQR